MVGSNRYSGRNNSVCTCGTDPFGNHDPNCAANKPSITLDEVAEVVTAARLRGMEAFVVIIPVDPKMLSIFGVSYLDAYEAIYNGATEGLMKALGYDRDN